MSKKQKFDGLGSVAEMLPFLDAKHREKLLKNLAEKDPKVAQAIRDRSFTFEDIFGLENALLQSVLGKIARKDLVLSLRGADEQIWLRLKQNLPEKAALILQEEVEALGPRKKAEVETIRRKIADQVRGWI